MRAPASRWPAVVTGLEAEAAIARLVLPRVAVSGGRPSRATALAQALVRDGARGLVSFGIAGGLDPDHGPGTLIIADRVFEGGVAFDADAAMIRALTVALPEARVGAVEGVDRIVRLPAEKADLFAGHGALAADMESHAVARVAREAGVPFAVLRAIADPATQTLPSAVEVGLDDAGRPQLMPVLARLAREPWTLPGLVAAGQSTRIALDALFRRGGGALLGLGVLGRVDLGHGLLDV